MIDIYIGSMDERHFGNQWTVIVNHEEPGCNVRVSENSLSYSARCALTDIRIYIKKESKEADWIRLHIESQDYFALKSYITHLVMRNALVSQLYIAIESRIQQAYNDGEHDAQTRMRAALGL